MRRWIWRVLLAAMVLASLAGTALAADEVTTPSGMKLKDEGSSWTVVKGYTGSATTLEIPETYENKPITKIDTEAFAGTKITSVRIPKTVQSVGDRAFAKCKNLKSVVFLEEQGNTGSIPIGEYAFAFCEQLVTLCLSENISVIGDYAFTNCAALTEVIIPDGVATIGTGAFASCGKLANVAISGKDTPVDVKDGAFTKNNTLKYLHCQGTVNFENPATTVWTGDAIHSATISSLIIGATCTNQGSITKTVDCGAAKKCTFKNIDMEFTLPHTPEEIAAEPATCTSDGKTAGERCKVCDSIITPQNVIRALGHDLELDPTGVETEPATCKDTGIRTYTDTCKRCGAVDTSRTEVIPVTDEHDYTGGKTENVEVKKATCTEEGVAVIYKVCGVCGKTKECEECTEYMAQMRDNILTDAHKAHLGIHGTVPIPIIDHTLGPMADTVYEEPDCATGTPGKLALQARTCTVCGEIIPAKDSDGNDIFEEIPAEHTPPAGGVKFTDTPATCTEPGERVYESYTCTVCGKEVPGGQTETIPALGHDWSGDAGAVMQEATCTKPGLRDPSARKCTRCGAFEEGDGDNQTEIPALGHLWSSPVIDETAPDYKAPTCTADGEATGTVTCIREGCHGDSDDPDAPPATRTQKFTLPALGHDWGEWTVTKEATETEAGSRERTCKREGCGEKEVREIPAGSGTVDPDDPDNPDQPTTPDNPGTTPEDTLYKIDLVQASNGAFSTNMSSARQGTTVTLTITPDAGYVVDMIRVIGGNSVLSLTNLGSNRYSFTMPAANVEIRVTFDREDAASGSNWSDGFGNSDTSGRSNPRRTTDVMPTQNPLLPSPTTDAYEQLFQDIPTGHWAAGEINWASQMGYMNGTNGKFNPDGNISAQQMWMVLARLTGANPANMAEAKTWAIRGGFADGSAPTGPVKRHQLVTALQRCARLVGSANRNTTSLAGYVDSRSVPTVARDAFSWALANGIVSGDADNKLNPNQFITRAQFAVILYRYSQRV